MTAVERPASSRRWILAGTPILDQSITYAISTANTGPTTSLITAPKPCSGCHANRAPDRRQNTGSSPELRPSNRRASDDGGIEVGERQVRPRCRGGEGAGGTRPPVCRLPFAPSVHRHASWSRYLAVNDTTVLVGHLIGLVVDDHESVRSFDAEIDEAVDRSGGGGNAERQLPPDTVAGSVMIPAGQIERFRPKAALGPSGDVGRQSVDLVVGRATKDPAGPGPTAPVSQPDGPRFRKRSSSGSMSNGKRSSTS